MTMRLSMLNEALVRSLPVCLAGLLLTSCASQLTEPATTLDTPEHHIYSGFRLLDREYLADAKREFELALGHAPGDSSAHRGLGLVYAMEGDFVSSEQALLRARHEARSERERARALVALMQFHFWRGGENWLATVEKLFEEAVTLAGPLPEAYYHMGLAYRRAQRLGEARQAFEKVLEINQVFVPQARQALAEIEKTASEQSNAQAGEQKATEQ